MVRASKKTWAIFASPATRHKCFVRLQQMELALTDISYEFRPSLPKGVQSYRVTDDTLVSPAGSVPLEEIASIRVYTVPGMRTLGSGTVAQPSRRCTIRCRNGRKIVLSSLDFVGIGRFTDRTQTYLPFVEALIAGVAARSPSTRLLTGMPPALWWYWMLTFATLAVMLGGIALLIAVGLLFGQLPWTAWGFVLAAAGCAIGPLQYVRGLRRRRPHPLDPASYEL